MSALIDRINDDLVNEWFHSFTIIVIWLLLASLTKTHGKIDIKNNNTFLFNSVGVGSKSASVRVRDELTPKHLDVLDIFADIKTTICALTEALMRGSSE